MAVDPTDPGLLSFEDARHVLDQHAATLRPGATELIDLLNSRGRILAETITADRDFPPFRRAARDGYALRSEDVQQTPASLEVVGEIKAGVALSALPIIQSGQTAAIMTGAPAPDGADAIVMVEYTSRQSNRVEIARGIDAGTNIVAVGSEAKAGQTLLSPQMRLDHAAIAVAASVGKSWVQVYAQPHIAILSTGDEIVDISAAPGPSQIRNSNTYSLAAQVQEAGGIPILLPVAPDELGRLRELILQGLNADLLLLAGGVSMGKYDLVEQVLLQLGAEFFFTGAKIQPGKPVVFGRILHGEQYKYFVGLPGNPVSTMVTFELFAKPLLQALAGASPQKLAFLHARLKSEIRTKTGLKRFLPATLSGEFERAEVELATWRGSGDIAAMVRANCYVVVPEERERIAVGEWVPVLMR